MVISTFNDVNNVTLTHSTDGFTCPYDGNFTDIHLNFEGCLGNTLGVNGAPNTSIPTQFRAEPCLERDSSNRCTRCVSDDYTIDASTGECVFTKTCGDNQFLQFGVCTDLAADANCGTFDFFTGDC